MEEIRNFITQLRNYKKFRVIFLYAFRYRVICIRDNIQGGVWKQFYLSRVLID